MTDVVLQTDELTKRYGRRVAVNRLSLHVARGEIYGFLGQNGAGKSTTIRMLLGLVRPTHGRVQILGHDLASAPLRARARVGALIETPAFYDNLTGRQNLRLFAALSGGTTAARTKEVLQIVGLAARADEPVRVYSCGMRQRLGLAQTLLPHPSLIILDEPTNGLDPQGIHEVRQLIRRLRDEFGLTVMLSSHLLAEIEQLSDRVAIIDAGRLLYQGTIAQLVAPAPTLKLRVDRIEDAYQLLGRDPSLTVRRNGANWLYVETPAEQVPALNAALVAHGIKVYELTLCRETLEAAFLKLTGAASRGTSEQEPTDK